MKLPLLLLALSALMIWCSSTLNGTVTSSPIVATAHPHQAMAAANIASLSARDASSADASAPPLFRTVTTPAALAGPQPGASFALVGLAGVGDTRVALLRDEADHRVFSVHLGDTAGDWRVSEASDRCVVLRKSRQRQSVCLS